MTHPAQNFKTLLVIVALCLPLGCSNDSSAPQTIQMTKHLQTLQVQSQILEEQALSIESQIDEIRRANTDTNPQRLKLFGSSSTLSKKHMIKCSKRCLLLENTYVKQHLLDNSR